MITEAKYDNKVDNIKKIQNKIIIRKKIINLL